MWSITTLSNSSCANSNPNIKYKHYFSFEKVRRELYAQCFEELIRQTLLNSLERGLLLLRWERRLHYFGFLLPLNLNSHANESNSGWGMSSDWLYMQQRPFMNRALHLVTGDTQPAILKLMFMVMLLTMMTILSTLLNVDDNQGKQLKQNRAGQRGKPTRNNLRWNQTEWRRS